MSCSAGCRAHWPGSAPSSPTPATSCAPRWRCSAASSSWRRVPAAAGMTWPPRCEVPPRKPSGCHVEARDGTLATVDGDRIRQAADNLLDNALRFAPRGSVIVLAARADGPDLGIEVRDDGPGFPVGFLP